MKKLFYCTLLLLLSASASAQSAADLARERRELAKMTRAELNTKASKDARKAAKQAEKEGWQVAPGALPLTRQFDRVYLMQYEYDEAGAPKYLMGEAMSIGQNYDAAKLQAIELAKQQLAGQIESEIAALIDDNVANSQLESEEATSIVETVQASKTIIAQKIGRIVPVVECYRTKSNKNKEVRVVVAYNTRTAMSVAQQALRQALQQKGDQLHEKLDKMLK